MGRKDGCMGKLEAATVSGILYLFGQGNILFTRENAGNFLKNNVCGNHDAFWTC